jgi:hypothetical protein
MHGGEAVSVLYYEFDITVGGRNNYAGTWRHVQVTRVTPDGEEYIGRVIGRTRRGALRQARRLAREDLRLLAARRMETGKVVWRP